MVKENLRCTAIVSSLDLDSFDDRQEGRVNIMTARPMDNTLF